MVENSNWKIAVAVPVPFSVPLLRIDLMQNVVLEDSKETEAPIRVNEEGETICDLAVCMIIYNEKGKPLRWAKVKVTIEETIEL